MRVLFVDDESRVLAGIERALFMHDVDWDCEFVNSGAEALASMEQSAADVVISDMRMPGMDGAALLEKVKTRWPETIRIILSGYSDTEAAMQALNVAHQFLAKPCENETLISKVERAISLRALLDNPMLVEKIGRVGQLPPAPKIYIELTRKMVDPTCDAAELAAVISRDPAITAKLLQLANSAYFSSVAVINSVAEAVARLGHNTVRRLVLTCEAYAQGPVNVDIGALQVRAMLASNLAERIAPDSRFRDASATAALLSEIGLLLPGICVGSHATTDCGHDDVCHHAEAGAYLLGLWDLPLEIVEAVALHCNPGKVHGDQFDVVGIVHAAVALADDKEADQAFLARTGQLEHWQSWQEMRDEMRRRAAA